MTVLPFLIFLCLPVTPGENVLDLCAAPGGKATALGAMLNGSGLLVANDISASRARALLRNIELFGITNAFVTNETPAHLGKHFKIGRASCRERV